MEKYCPNLDVCVHAGGALFLDTDDADFQTQITQIKSISFVLQRICVPLFYEHRFLKSLNAAASHLLFFEGCCHRARAPPIPTHIRPRMPRAHAYAHPNHYWDRR